MDRAELECYKPETIKLDKEKWIAAFLKDRQLGFKKIYEKFLALNVVELSSVDQVKETAFWVTLIQRNFKNYIKNQEALNLQSLSRHSLDLLHRSLKEEDTIVVNGERRTNELHFYRSIDGKVIIENSLQMFTKLVRLNP